MLKKKLTHHDEILEFEIYISEKNIFISENNLCMNESFPLYKTIERNKYFTFYYIQLFCQILTTILANFNEQFCINTLKYDFSVINEKLFNVNFSACLLCREYSCFSFRINFPCAVKQNIRVRNISNLFQGLKYDLNLFMSTKVKN